MKTLNTILVVVLSLSLIAAVIPFSSEVDAMKYKIKLNHKSSSSKYTVCGDHLCKVSTQMKETKSTKPKEATVQKENPSAKKESKDDIKKIILITRHYSPAEIQYMYRFTVKVFDADMNPSHNLSCTKCRK